MLDRSIRVGKLYGVEVKVHPTFALVFLWVIYQWGWVADTGNRGMVFGTMVLISVFGCVLAHELAHAVVAMRHGLAVQDVTLLPFGGVARIQHASLTPRSETLIAMAGPAVNLVIAALLTPAVLLVAVVNNVTEVIDFLLYTNHISAGGFILYVWLANVALALFNLLPAFPMDGGRVLRAQLSNGRNKLGATRLAVNIGQLFAVGIAVLGVLSGDYLIFLVTGFILIYAYVELRYVDIESKLRKMPVGQFALWETGGIHPHAALAQAVRGGPRDLVVTQDGQVVGMLWRRELLQHLNGTHNEVRVKDVMDRRFHPVDPNDSVFDVHLWLSDSNRSAVPVVENGQYRGIFTGERLMHLYHSIGRQNQRWQRDGVAGILSRLRLGVR